MDTAKSSQDISLTTLLRIVTVFLLIGAILGIYVANAAADNWLSIGSSSGGNVTTPGQGNYTYANGAVVGLVATPDTGYSFGIWTGNTSTIADVNATSTTITSNGNYTIAANFSPTPYTLTISSTAGGNVTTPGEGGFSPYYYGNVTGLLAVPDTGYQFVNWTGNTSTIADTNATSTTITMNGNNTIAANFSAIPYTLTISSTAGGNVTTPGEGSFSPYYFGNATSLLAVPDTGYQFVNWTGNTSTIADTNATSTTITMNGNNTIAANFSAIPYTLTIDSTIGGSVTTPGEGSFGSYNYGNVVSLVAVPAEGYIFSGWTGSTSTIAGTGSASTTITMNGNYSITANFPPIAPPAPPYVPPATPTVEATPTIEATPAPVSSTVDITEYIDPDGIVLVYVEASSLDNVAVMEIAEETVALTADGGPLQYVDIGEVADPPAPPPATYTVGSAYDFGPDGATFNPPSAMSINYDPTSVPEAISEEDLVIAYFDTDVEEWIALESSVDTISHSVTAQVSHFTVFTVYGTEVAAMPTITPIATVSVTPSPTTTIGPTPTPTWTPTTVSTQTPTPTLTPVSTDTESSNILLIIGVVVGALIAMTLAVDRIRRRIIRRRL